MHLVILPSWSVSAICTRLLQMAVNSFSVALYLSQFIFHPDI